MKADRQAAGESALHQRAKAEIAESLSQHTGVSDVATERRLAGVRPDVSCHIGDHQVAVEVQCSEIEENEVRRRTEIYAALGWYVLWLCPAEATPIDMAATDKPIRSIGWQHYLHDLYGQLVVWTGGQSVVGLDLTHSRRQGYGLSSAMYRYPHFGDTHLISALSPDDCQVWITDHDRWVPTLEERRRDLRVRQAWDAPEVRGLLDGARQAYSRGEAEYKIYRDAHPVLSAPDDFVPLRYGERLRMLPDPYWSPPPQLVPPAKLWVPPPRPTPPLLPPKPPRRTVKQ